MFDKNVMANTETEKVCKDFLAACLDGKNGFPFLTFKYKSGSEMDRLPQNGEKLEKIIASVLDDEKHTQKLEKVIVKIEKDGKITSLNEIEIV